MSTIKGKAQKLFEAEVEKKQIERIATAIGQIERHKKAIKDLEESINRIETGEDPIILNEGSSIYTLSNSSFSINTLT